VKKKRIMKMMKTKRMKMKMKKKKKKKMMMKMIVKTIMNHLKNKKVIKLFLMKKMLESMEIILI